jgi:hypothetical protein
MRCFSISLLNTITSFPVLVAPHAPLIVEHARHTAAKTVRVKDTEGASSAGLKYFLSTFDPRALTCLAAPTLPRSLPVPKKFLILEAGRFGSQSGGYDSTLSRGELR